VARVGGEQPSHRAPIEGASFQSAPARTHSSTRARRNANGPDAGWRAVSKSSIRFGYRIPYSSTMRMARSSRSMGVGEPRDRRIRLVSSFEACSANASTSISLPL
jgi:hypothetical protein